MATIYISEYAGICSPGPEFNGMQAPAEPALAEQAVNISGSSTQSAAFNAQTRFIRCHTDSICSILFGVNPTAVTSAKRMAASQTEYFGVVTGQKLAVISNV